MTTPAKQRVFCNSTGAFQGVDYDRERTEVILRVRRSEGRGRWEGRLVLTTTILAAVTALAFLFFA